MAQDSSLERWSDGEGRVDRLDFAPAKFRMASEGSNKPEFLSKEL